MRSLPILLCLLLLGCQRHVGELNNPFLPKTAPGMAAGEVGNGGHGIKIGDKIFLYDLWEAGMENGPRHAFDRASLAKGMVTQRVAVPGGTLISGRNPVDDVTSLFFADEVARSFSEESLKSLVPKVADRLAVIYELDPVLAMSLGESIRAHSWAITDVELGPVTLPDPVHKLGERQVVLLANRSGRFIYLFRKYWSRMDDFNRVGLILHEAIYSLLPPLRVALPHGGETLRQDGKRARQITALLSGMKSYALLYETGLEGDINRSELPLLLDPGERTFDVTSTFFSRLGKSQRALSPENRLSLVGPAQYRLAIPSENSFTTFALPAFEVLSMKAELARERFEKLKGACEALAKDRSVAYQLELVFAGSPAGGKGYEIQVAYYQEREEMKQYLKFTPLTKPTVQIASKGRAQTFFDIATPLDAIFTHKAPGFEEVVKACQTYLTGVTGRAGFYYPARYPADPRERYGH